MSGRYYISNADMSALEFYQRIRGHWSIENGLHGSLDLVFGEDAGTVSKGYAHENLDIVRKVVLLLLRATKNPEYQSKKRMSGPKKMVIASLNPDYMFAIFFAT